MYAHINEGTNQKGKKIHYFSGGTEPKKSECFLCLNFLKNLQFFFLSPSRKERLFAETPNKDHKIMMMMIRAIILI